MKDILTIFSKTAAAVALFSHIASCFVTNRGFVYAEIICWFIYLVLKTVAQHKSIDLVARILIVCGLLLQNLISHQILPSNPLIIAFSALPIVGLLILLFIKKDEIKMDEFTKYFMAYLLPLLLGIAAIFLFLFGAARNPVNPYLIALSILLGIVCLIRVFMLVRKGIRE